MQSCGPFSDVRERDESLESDLVEMLGNNEESIDPRTIFGVLVRQRENQRLQRLRDERHDS